MLHSNISVNEQGHLTFAGQDTVELAERFGTALYLLDEDRVRENCRKYTETMKRCFPEGSGPLYASKALCFKRLYKTLMEEDMSVDVVSGGELRTALAAGFPAERIYFHGNNKTVEEIHYAMDSGIGYFIVDNYDELHEISYYAREKGVKQKILLRLTVGIDPHTFEAVNTGKIDCQFGTAVETGQAIELVGDVLRTGGVELDGFHCHIGSQIFEWTPFRDAAVIMLDFMSEVYEEFGYKTRVLNMGGGFGVRYTEEDPHVDIPDSIERLAEFMRDECAKRSLTMPIVLMEPGRSIVADAGMTIYTAGGVKTIKDHKSYVAVDGGMADNPRYALYQSPYTAINAQRANDPADFLCTLAGRCCESGALIQENIMLARPNRGEKIAVFVTGAYNYSMASNYNRFCRPPLVMLHGGEAELAIRRETFEDMIACDL
ncbi:MAG: diaminopimelate decarboxylase [Oscillospiraceae bacterium]|nr:diaminopimelate decarboxylase [Oscillospiraceae bacterium]